MEIGTIIIVASFVVSIFAANWLNQRSNERLVESLRNEMKAGNLAIQAEIQSVRAEIKTLENRIISLDTRMERVERQLDRIFKPSLPK